MILAFNNLTIILIYASNLTKRKFGFIIDDDNKINNIN